MSSNPYPGLRPFEADEEHLFFGREARIDELLGRLRRTRFLAVVGTSGSGKSSLIRSGLIPSLYSGFMTRAGSSWRVAVMRPGDDPIGHLATVLNASDVLGPEEDELDMSRAMLEATLFRSEHGLRDAYRRAGLPEGENLLIVADQFEELFRFKANRRIEGAQDAALAFVKLLLRAADDREDSDGEAPPIYVVITMRSDFIGSCTEFPGLAEAINEGQYLIPRLSRQERRAAITGPAAVGGAEVSRRLVQRLLNDVGDDPDQLPIMQHALMRTWDYWQDHRGDGEPVDLRHYEAIGTLERALSMHAEEAYRELTGPGQKEIAERLFKALTDKGPGSRGVRRPVRVDEVVELTGADEAQIETVVDRFRAPGRSFLMPPAGVRLSASTILDISHESLMRAWERLIRWVEEEARSAQLYRRISQAAERYHAGEGALLRDPELQLALNWRTENRPTLGWAERYDPAFERAMLFLEHSEAERTRELEARERRRRKQLRLARWLVVVLGSAALLAGGVGLYALRQKEVAEEQRLLAVEQQQKAEESEREAIAARQRAVEEKEAAEAARRNALAQRERAEAEKERAEEERLRAERQTVVAETERRRAEDKEREAKAAEDEARRQQQVAEEEKARAEEQKARAEAEEERAERLALLSAAHALELQAVRLAHDRPEPAALLAYQAYRLNRDHGGVEDDAGVFTALRTALGEVEPTLGVVVHRLDDAVRALAWTADGGVVAGGDDGRLVLFPAATGARPATLVNGGAEVRALTVSGGRLAVGFFDGSVRLWELARPGASRLLVAAGAPISALAFVDGSIVAVGDAAGGLRAIELAGGAASVLNPPLHTMPGRIEALAPFAGRLALAGAFGVATWDWRTPEEPPEGLIDDLEARSLVAVGDELLAIGTAAGAIELRDAGAEVAGVALQGHTAPVSGLAYGKDRELLASSSLDGTVRLWRLGDQAEEPAVIADHGGWVWGVALSADGERCATAGADRTLRLYPTSTRPLAEEVCRRVSRNLTRDEWHDYMPPEMPYAPICPGLPIDDDAAEVTP